MKGATVNCSGACEKSKHRACFTPSQLRAAHPVCRECQRKARARTRPRKEGKPRGYYFRLDAYTLCPGSGTGLERIGA